MADLRVGVVGLGLGRHFVAALAASRVVGRIVVCDPDEARRKEMQTAHPAVAVGCESLDEMLGREALDAVCVVTPDHLHRPHAEACLAAGCHVLLTKPLATSLEDGRSIVRAAEGADRLLLVAHERRFRSRFRRVRDLLDGGGLGDVIAVCADAIQDKRRQFARSPWYASAEAGRTPLTGTAIHEVDLVRWFAGRPIESVMAISSPVGTLDFHADTTTAALFRFEGGAVGEVTVTYEARWPPTGGAPSPFRLIGTRGTVVDGRVAIDGRDHWETLPDDRQAIVTGIFGCVANFLDAVEGHAPAAVTGREAFASLAGCVAADTSAATGRPAEPAPADFT